MNNLSFNERLEEANHLLIYKKYEEALEIYEELLKEGSSAELHNNYGLTLFYLDRVDDALREFERAIKIDENFSLPYVNMGLIYLNQENYDKAIESLKKALSLDSKNPEAHYNIAVSYYRLNRKKEALNHYEEFLKYGGEEYSRLKESVKRIVEQIKIDLSTQENFQE